MRNQFKLLTGAALTSLLMLAASLVYAQDTPGNLAELWLVTVQSGHQAEFESGLKEHMQLRVQHKDPQNWQVFVPVTGDRLTTYVIRSCCFSWTEKDAFVVWDQNNPAVMEQWFTKQDPHTAGYAHYFNEIDGDNSHWADNPTAPPMVGVSDYMVRPDQSMDFEKARKQLSQVALNQGWAEQGYHWAWLSRIGGKPMTSLVVPYENYAAMQMPAQTFSDFLVEKMGQEEAMALMSQFSGSTHSSHYTVYQHRPDLSMPAPE